MALTKKDLTSILEILQPEFQKLEEKILINTKAINKNRESIDMNTAKLDLLTSRFDHLKKLTKQILHKIGDYAIEINELRIDSRHMKNKVFSSTLNHLSDNPYIK